MPFELRLARPEDSEAIARLTLEGHHHLYQAALGGLDRERIVGVLIDTRDAAPELCRFTIVATVHDQLAGFVGWVDEQFPLPNRWAQLRALAQVGPWGMLRFLLVWQFAFLSHRPGPGEVRVKAVTVGVRFRKQGIGAALLSEIERRCSAPPGARIVGMVAEQNVASLALFRSVGYRPERKVRMRIRGWAAGEPVMIRLVKPLSGP